MNDDEIKKLIVEANAPLLKRITDLEIEVKLLKDIVANVPDDVVYP